MQETLEEFFDATFVAQCMLGATAISKRHWEHPMLSSDALPYSTMSTKEMDQRAWIRVIHDRKVCQVPKSFHYTGNKAWPMLGTFESMDASSWARCRWTFQQLFWTSYLFCPFCVVTTLTQSCNIYSPKMRNSFIVIASCSKSVASNLNTVIICCSPVGYENICVP